MRDADYIGLTAKAWRPRAAPNVAEQMATLSSWVVNGAFHPFWSYWAMAVYHLRGMPGSDVPVHRLYPDARYEFIILSLDPNHYPPDIDGEGPVRYLNPPDMMFQFHFPEDNDERAGALCDDAMKAICDGSMSPDSDFRSRWYDWCASTIAEVGGQGMGAGLT